MRAQSLLPPTKAQRPRGRTNQKTGVSGETLRQHGSQIQTATPTTPETRWCRHDDIDVSQDFLQNLTAQTTPDQRWPDTTKTLTFAGQNTVPSNATISIGTQNHTLRRGQITKTPLTHQLHLTQSLLTTRTKIRPTKPKTKNAKIHSPPPGLSLRKDTGRIQGHELTTTTHSGVISCETTRHLPSVIPCNFNLFFIRGDTAFRAEYSRPDKSAPRP